MILPETAETRRPFHDGQIGGTHYSGILRLLAGFWREIHDAPSEENPLPLTPTICYNGGYERQPLMSTATP